MTEIKLTPDQSDILDFMETHGGITGTQAIEMGIYDYRKRISELRALGVPIDDAWQTGFKRNGNRSRYKRYFLTEVTKDE